MATNRDGRGRKAAPVRVDADLIEWSETFPGVVGASFNEYVNDLMRQDRARVEREQPQTFEVYQAALAAKAERAARAAE